MNFTVPIYNVFITSHFSLSVITGFANNRCTKSIVRSTNILIKKLSKRFVSV